MATEKQKTQQQQPIKNNDKKSKKKFFVIFCLLSILLIYVGFKQFQKLSHKDANLIQNQRRSMMIETPTSDQKQMFSTIPTTESSFLTTLKDYLSWSIDPLYSTLFLQDQKSFQMPVMVSINTKDIFQNDTNIKKMTDKYHWTLKDLPSRPNIDLICVIDNSPSMLDAHKLDHAKETLKYMLEFLRDDDHLALVTFNYHSNILLPLTKMKDNKEHILNLISNLESTGGGTNILAGMWNAFEIIQHQDSSTFKNKVTSILLLSDGQDNTNYNNLPNMVAQRYNEVFKNQDEKSMFSINTFGYGSDHDSDQLSKISDLKNGNFFYISNLKLLKKYFLSVFGSLATTLCTDLQIQVKSKNNNFTVIKTYGTQWEQVIDNKNNVYFQLKQPQIEYGKQYNFVFELLILNPNSTQATITNSSQKDFFVNFQCIPTRSLTINDDKIFEERKFLFINEGNFSQQTRSYDYKVQKNFLRMKAVEIIEQARNSSEKNLFEEAKIMIKNMTKQLKKFEIELKTKKIDVETEDWKELEAIQKDLEDLLLKCDRTKFQNEGGKHEFQDRAKKYNSRVFHPDKEPIYQNSIQNYYNDL